MKSIDPERERQRLVELYASRSDEELQELAEDYTDLTEMARKALKDEMERRGLHLEDTLQVTDEVEQPLITIRTFFDRNEALLAGGVLESAGVECSLADDNMARIEIGIAIGIRLRVREDDVEAAIEILDAPLPDKPEDQG